MRGYAEFNFPAFDLYKEKLTSEGHEVFSPADLDRDEGFDQTKSLEENGHTTEDFLRRDVEAIINSDGVALMPNWEKSTGCNMEVAIALFLDKPCYQLEQIGEKPY